MSDHVSVVDLNILFTFIFQRKFKFRVGPERTRADGSCFCHMLLQNMKHFYKLGVWKKNIPKSVHELRRDIVNYMKLNKKEYLGYWNQDKFIEGTHDEASFQRLIEDQSRLDSYTDEEGFFVAAAARFLDIEIKIVVTSIQTPVIDSGAGGPIQRINAGGNKIVFCAGLIRNEQVRTGHYQWIIADERGESAPFVMPAETTLLFETVGGVYHITTLEIFHINLKIKFQVVPLQLLQLHLLSRLHDQGSLSTT